MKLSVLRVDKKKGTILVVSERESLPQFVRENLQNWEVKSAGIADSTASLLKVLDAKPDLIILEVTLPVENSIATLKHLKASPTTRDVPIMAFVPAEIGEHILEPYLSKRDLCLTQPVDPVYLQVYAALMLGLLPIPDDPLAAKVVAMSRSGGAVSFTVPLSRTKLKRGGKDSGTKAANVIDARELFNKTRESEET